MISAQLSYAKHVATEFIKDQGICIIVILKYCLLQALQQHQKDICACGCSTNQSDLTYSATYQKFLRHQNVP